MVERILLMGGPGTGKSHQIILTCQYLQEIGKEMWIIDLDDKLEPMLSGFGGTPKNMHLDVALSWEDLRATVDVLKKGIKPGNWVAVDRVDLAWSMVQRWYTRQKYNEELADRLLKADQRIKKSAMLIPRFEQGSWQTINEQYEYVLMSILYETRCHCLLTAGVKSIREDESSPYETFAHIGILPRGQKELSHQPTSAFLLHIRREGKKNVHLITTAKELYKSRSAFDGTVLTNFSEQYLLRYAT